MIIQSSRFGEVDIDENLIFDFVMPIIGYENLSKYVIIEPKKDSLFNWLQSVEDPDLAFPVTLASYFNIDYTFDIDEEYENLLDIKSANDLLILNIAKIPAGQPRKSTINLLGPIVINTLNKKAMQLVLSSQDYSSSHPLFNDEDSEVTE